MCLANVVVTHKRASQGANAPRLQHASNAGHARYRRSLAGCLRSGDWCPQALCTSNATLKTPTADQRQTIVCLCTSVVVEKRSAGLSARLQTETTNAPGTAARILDCALSCGCARAYVACAACACSSRASVSVSQSRLAEAGLRKSVEQGGWQASPAARLLVECPAQRGRKNSATVAHDSAATCGAAGRRAESKLRHIVRRPRRQLQIAPPSQEQTTPWPLWHYTAKVVHPQRPVSDPADRQGRRMTTTSQRERAAACSNCHSPRRHEARRQSGETTAEIDKSDFLCSPMILAKIAIRFSPKSPRRASPLAPSHQRELQPQR